MRGKEGGRRESEEQQFDDLRLKVVVVVGRDRTREINSISSTICVRA